MSEFSDLLSLFIKTRDVNVSALTAYCELDRSTMYKLINGKRSPSSKALVKKLASFMNLNPLETQELIQAYLLSKVGWETYYSRKNVLEFLLSFADVRSESSFLSDCPSSTFDFNFSVAEKGTSALSSQLQIVAALSFIIIQMQTKPQSTLSILAQPEHLEGLNLAASLPHQNTNMHIQHILCINNRKSYIRSQHNYNIQCLKKLIPFYEKSVVYEPYYYYDNVNSHFNNLNFLPCMFLTDSAAILCSSDLKEGVLIQEPETIALFQRRFQKILMNTSPLTATFHSILNLHLKNFAMIYKDSSNAYGLSAEPCLVPLFTRELMDKYLEESLPSRDIFIQELIQYADTLSKAATHTYFTREGATHFLMTGYLHEIPRGLCKPFEYENRVKLLKKFCEQVESAHDIRLLKGSLEKFPLNLNISITVNYGYLMFSGQSTELSYILLKEQNLLASFYDFASSLEENELLETKEETIQFLQNLIQHKKL